MTQRKELCVYGNYAEYHYSKHYEKWKYISSITALYGHKDTILHLRGSYWKNPITDDMRELKSYCDTHNIKID